MEQPKHPTREEIEARQEKLRDRISTGIQRRRQLNYLFSMAEDEKARDEAEAKLRDNEDALRRAEQELDGLTFGLEKLSEQEREEQAAALAAKRRQAAVEILALVNQRYWATVELDEAFAAVRDVLGHIESLRQLLVTYSSWFGDDADGLRNFLMYIDALDLTDTAYRVRQNFEPERLPSFSNDLPTRRPTALRMLAKVLPEVEDKAVQKEATERARQASDEETKESAAKAA